MHYGVHEDLRVDMQAKFFSATARSRCDGVQHSDKPYGQMMEIV